MWSVYLEHVERVERKVQIWKADAEGLLTFVSSRRGIRNRRHNDHCDAVRIVLGHGRGILDRGLQESFP